VDPTSSEACGHHVPPGAGIDGLRVALVAPPWLPVPPPAYGGTEAVVDRLAAGLSRLGADVTLVAHPQSTCSVRRLSTGLPRGEPGDRAAETAHAEMAYELLADLDLDVVHDHTLCGPGIAVQRRADERWLVVTTNHWLFDDEAERYLRPVDAKVAVVAVSHHQASTARTVRVAEVIHHGVDVDDFPLGAGDGGYLVSLGRMSPTKGVHLAIDVARRAGVPLLIAGKLREPAEHEYFDAEIRPRLGRGVEYLGEANHEDKVRLLQGATALLNPICWAEPFGMVMIESLACGTPVLAFPRGAASEIIEHGTVGALCGGVDAMVAAVSQSPQFDRRLCRAHVQQHFSTERMAAEHARLYLAGRPRPLGSGTGNGPPGAEVSSHDRRGAVSASMSADSNTARSE
jgi:glycosyltransferase involved in cell wall biosynthesis